ncbi:hypothetical protein LOD99_7558 [Oopsacas minuta]|uniref:VLIG-type G domain-containing protein n=1 Tax=Oopsacas minuta TaxID=111878 RepID=A0AAV7JNF4_9METZ|nr:hypothetical protein LOD99_7558 [Oopsacas minuta]
MEEFCKHINVPRPPLISLKNVIKISFTQPQQEITSHSELPNYMLNKIMMLDSTSRKFPQPIDYFNPTPDTKSTLNIMRLVSKNISDNQGIQIHPMDVFLFLFIHCDPIFRQTFITQVSKCQLSLPLIASYPSAQEPTFYLFALKTLYKDYLSENNTGISFSVAEQRLPIISFIRIGECGKSQKSEMLNQIVGIPDYFFHRNQLGNAKKRYFLDGTVEIAWLLPINQPQHTPNILISQPCVILNLRGNAMIFPKQLDFITSISTLLYIFVPFNQCDQSICQNLGYIHQQHMTKLVYLLYVGDPPIPPVFEPTIPEFLEEQSNTVLFLRKESLGQDSHILAQNISSNLQNVPILYISLDDCKSIAIKYSISLDTHENNIDDCQTIVDTILHQMFHTPLDSGQCESLAVVKQSMLPLQTQCWSQWAEANRELHIVATHDYEQSAKSKKKDAREQQLQILQNPSSLLINIIKHCNSFGSSDGDFYTIWNLLSNDFNTLSKLHLPPLYENYKMLHKKSYSTDTESDMDIDQRDQYQQQCKQELVLAARSIAESSFGIEHIFRELGQLFELYNFCSKKQRYLIDRTLDFQILTLQTIAANLLIEGHAFEIIDGDVNHIAMKWVKNVLKSLTSLIGYKKKIFVVSILGTQSTGKSTLLNTMFGAKFPVSSGRCTRGIFMQLIPIEEKLRSQLRYDYVVILDTEGLRAPELSINSSYRRDNELATIAVGLGDVTVINIYGEGHSDVQDILQIIVFAFIRMKESFSKPRCMFVHQNVPDTHAHTNLISARSNLIKTLDKMTECAALQENKHAFYKQFADVIEFHPDEEVFYFPGLFEGEPPLSRVSSGYSRKSGMLRHTLLNCFANNPERKFQSLGDWSKKLELLWKSVLEENFVFSYRNALEVTSRFELDRKISSWHSSYIQSLNKWKSDSINQLFNADFEEIDGTYKNILSILQDEMITPSIEFPQQEVLMVCYFVDHENVEIFSQWKANTALHFESRREKHMHTTEKEYQRIYNLQKTKKKMDENYVKYRKEIVSKVKTLFADMNQRGESLKNNSLLDSKFQTIWDEWKSQIEVEEAESVNISNDLQRIILDSDIIKSMHVISDKSILLKETNKFLTIGQDEFTNSTLLHLQNESTSYFYLKDIIKKVMVIVGTIKKIFSRTPNTGANQFKTILGILDTECRREINDYLSSLLNSESPYDANYFHIIIDICYNILHKQNSTQKCNLQQSLEFSMDFFFDYIFYQCCKAIPTLWEIHEQFTLRTSLSLKFEQLEENFKFTFNQLCQGIESEHLCASELARITMSGLKDRLADSVPQIFLSIFMQCPKHDTIFKDRSSLILRILKDLARDRDFDKYLSYIKDPNNYLVDFVQKQLKEYSTKDFVLKRILKELLTKLNMEIPFCISECNKACPQDDILISGTWTRFKEDFYSRINQKVRNVSFSDLDVLDLHNISNYPQFCDFYAANLESPLNDVELLEWIKNILNKEVSLYKNITDAIHDCQELCPFCNELCQLSSCKHEHYCSTFHRPQGLFGWRYIETQQIVLSECTTNIRYNCKFLYEGKYYDYVKYKSVNARFKSWKILGEDALESKYWRWVLCQFEDNFVKHYDILPNPETSNWKHLTEDDVIEDLESQYRHHIFKKD